MNEELFNALQKMSQENKTMFLTTLVCKLFDKEFPGILELMVKIFNIK